MISQRVKERFPSLFWDPKSLDMLTELSDIPLESRLLKRTISPKGVRRDMNHSVVSTNKIKDKSTGADVEITEVTVPKKGPRDKAAQKEDVKKMLNSFAGLVQEPMKQVAQTFQQVTSSVVHIGSVLQQMGFVVVPPGTPPNISGDKLFIKPLPLFSKVFGEEKKKYLKNVPGCKSYSVKPDGSFKRKKEKKGGKK